MGEESTGSISWAAKDSAPVLSCQCPDKCLNLTKAVTPSPLEGTALVSWAEEGLVGGKGFQGARLHW